MQLGSFGPIVFETSSELVRTWQQMSRKGGARFHEHVVAQGKPLLEFLGPSLEEMTFTMRLDAQLGLDPAMELERMRETRDTGKEQVLVVGGLVIGKFVLEDLSEDHKRHSGIGRLMVAEVTVKLKEYVTNGY